MLNQSVAPRECFSFFALNMRWAIYPPPPGSAPGYQAAHHCTPMYIRKVRIGSVQRLGVVRPAWKSGRNESTLEAGWPPARVAERSEERREGKSVDLGGRRIIK